MVTVISRRYEHCPNGPYACGDGVRKECGFTLIELIVVMAVIATLLTLALPNYLSGVERAKEAVLRENLAAMRNALDQFQADNGKYPESLDDLVAKRYLRRVPVDPMTESATTWVVKPVPPDAGMGGVYDVNSGAKGTSKDGKPFGDY